MLINLRNALMTGKKWKNPYFGRDLCYLDGIWNVAGGVHDPNATSWVNLATGQAIALPSGFTPEQTAVAVTNASTSMRVCNFSGDEFTVEYVFSLSDSNTHRECLFESESENRGFRFRADSRVSDFWNMPLYEGVFFNRSENVGISRSIACSWRDIYSDTIADRIGVDYLGGVQLRTGNLQAKPVSIGPFRIGRARYTTYQRIYAIGISSRVLTAAEIAANYAIDKARFGLS